MSSAFKKYLLRVTAASDCKENEVIQSLWSGYGNIVRYRLFGASVQTVIVKNISLKKAKAHPRGWDTDRSHNRKVKSYEVESNWYKNWNQLINDNCSTPEFIGSFRQDSQQWIVLEDLDANFPLRKNTLVLDEVKVCLKWLAYFHATFLNTKPTGLWAIGTYWHLETRPDEFEKIDHAVLKAKAHLIDTALNECKYQTIVHGDAKLANFCFSQDGRSVAGVDFQYVGGGCGMKDVAYFLGSCLDNDDLIGLEVEMLDFYFRELHQAVNISKLKIDNLALEAEWRKMYPIACADFTRFLMGWQPSHQKINAYQLKTMELVLSKC